MHQKSARQLPVSCSQHECFAAALSDHVAQVRRLGSHTLAVLARSYDTYMHACLQGPAGGAPGIDGWAVDGWDVNEREHVDLEQVST